MPELLTALAIVGAEAVIIGLLVWWLARWLDVQSRRSLRAYDAIATRPDLSTGEAP